MNTEFGPEYSRLYSFVFRATMEGSGPRVCFEVERVIGISDDGNYQVQWAPAWVSKFQLVGCEHLIQDFLQRQTEKESDMELMSTRTDSESDAVLPKYSLHEDDTLADQSFDSNDQFDDKSGNEDENNVKTLIFENGFQSDNNNEPNFQDDSGDDDSDEYENNFVNINPENISIKIEDEEEAQPEPELFFMVSDKPENIVLDKDQAHVVYHKLGNWPSKKSCISPKENTPKRNYSCPLCRKQFPIKVALREHFRIHSSYKPFVCPHCLTGFSRNVNLKKHLSTHNNEHLHQCTHCDKSFARKDDMERHIRLHSGEKSYTCDVCGKSFARHYHLRRHQLIHTGEKDFQCTLCDKSYSTKSYLQDHMQRHEGFRPYACDLCKKTFARTSELAKHMLTHGTELGQSMELDNGFTFDVQGYP